ESLESWNNKLFSEFYEENYKENYANPSYSVKLFGKLGSLFSMIYFSVANMACLAAEDKKFMMTFREEVFVSLYEIACKKLDEDSFYNEVCALINKKYHDNVEISRRTRINELVNPDINVYTDIIIKCDLNDIRYLYFYGKHVTKNEVETAKFLNSLTDGEIKSMADTFTNGYLVGYEKLGKDIHNKKSVALYYTLGFERMEKAVMENMKKEGISCICRSSNLQTSSANRQADYDHKDDMAAFFDEEYLSKFIESTKKCFEEQKVNANGFAGPLALETFGEKEFNPENKKEALHYSDEQQALYVKLSNEVSVIQSKYIIPEERSFSIISYPIPEIGDNFKKVFSETVKINTLDYKTYETIQQKLIDALDCADVVKVKGRGCNKTDITVKIHEIKDKAKESAFENCVADVNIPVGEVFTSPVLKGTNGLLHVSKVYLNGMLVKDLSIQLKDGMIEKITCGNFDNDKDNKEYLDDIIMFHHDSLPIGEFAIGTNTSAYRMGIDYNVQDKLPILIAEKTGPHFAFGDTCYSRSEEIKVFNPDGKEIIARDNEVSLLRKSDISKAYFNCHTDVTIPYNELDTIIVIKKNGDKIELIRNGRFVLDGTEELNKALDN
ncbi:MAG: aminopeptidase, partial [Treponema sp.]|nr:aminopeptidase [Treponema sp.]